MNRECTNLTSLSGPPPRNGFPTRRRIVLQYDWKVRVFPGRRQAPSSPLGGLFCVRPPLTVAVEHAFGSDSRPLAVPTIAPAMKIPFQRVLIAGLRDLARRRPEDAEEYIDAHQEEWEALVEDDPHDAADILEALNSRSAAQLIADLDIEDVGDVLDEMRPEAAADLMEELTPEQAAILVGEMGAL